jgi:hypothetical protein
MVFISYPDKKTAAQIAGYISIMSDIFLRLIKMLIGPLVFPTLVVGIAHMGDAKSVGCIFAQRSLLRRLTTSICRSTQLTMMAILMLTSKGMAGVAARIVGGRCRKASVFRGDDENRADAVPFAGTTRIVRMPSLSRGRRESCGCRPLFVIPAKAGIQIL